MLNKCMWMWLSSYFSCLSMRSDGGPFLHANVSSCFIKCGQFFWPLGRLSFSRGFHLFRSVELISCVCDNGFGPPSPDTVCELFVYLTAIYFYVTYLDTSVGCPVQRHVVWGRPSWHYTVEPIDLYCSRCWNALHTCCLRVPLHFV